MAQEELAEAISSAQPHPQERAATTAFSLPLHIRKGAVQQHDGPTSLEQPFWCEILAPGSSAFRPSAVTISIGRSGAPRYPV
jgi:hypothetical protein